MLTKLVGKVEECRKMNAAVLTSDFMSSDDLYRHGLLLYRWTYTHNTSNCKGAEHIQPAIKAPTAMMPSSQR